MGYKTQVQALSDFYDDYGLKGGEDEGEEDDEDDEDDMSEEEDALMDGADGDSGFDDDKED